MSDTYDSPWKEIIELYFEELLDFFFPRAHQEIDWSHGYQSLDKELARVVRDSTAGERFADKLMRVRREDGEPGMVLVHVEIQGDRDSDFGQRMFTYSYRLFDRYRLPVASFAILGDDSPGWRPDGFGWSLWDSEMGLRFPVVKLLDYNDCWETLEASDSPFATVVMTHLATRVTRGAPEDRMRWKLRLTRRLYERGYARREILELFRFIDWLLALPPELEREFSEEHHRFEERLKMRYITSVERIGIEKGMAQGMQKGMAALLERQLSRRFGPLGETDRARLSRADSGELIRWADRLLEASSLDQIFADS